MSHPLMLLPPAALACQSRRKAAGKPRQSNTRSPAPTKPVGGGGAGERVLESPATTPPGARDLAGNDASGREPAAVRESQDGPDARQPRRRGQIDPRFEVRRDPNRPRRGRGIFALQDVRAGTRVMVAYQSAAVPKDAYRAAFCRRCLSLLDKSTLIKCRRCEDRFCGKECVIAAAGEGTHEATCAFMEASGPNAPPAALPGGALPPAYAPAATETELMRLTMECLARRRAGLCGDEEWDEILDLEGCGVAPGGGDRRGVDGGAAGAASATPENRVFHPSVLQEAGHRLKGGAREVPVEEMEMVHSR